jgi:hypothetical protein
LSTAEFVGEGGESALMAAVVPAVPALPDDVAALKRLVLAREADELSEPLRCQLFG